MTRAVLELSAMEDSVAQQLAYEAYNPILPLNYTDGLFCMQSYE